MELRINRVRINRSRPVNVKQPPAMILSVLLLLLALTGHFETVALSGQQTLVELHASRTNERCTYVHLKILF